MFKTIMQGELTKKKNLTIAKGRIHHPSHTEAKWASQSTMIIEQFETS